MIQALKKIIGDEQQRKLKKYKKMVEDINALEQDIEQLSDEDLKAKTSYFKEQLESGKTITDIQIEAFAVVREASKRVLGLRHFDVQLIGGLVLSEGQIAEMPTGEGKTLVASLPSYLRALEGKGVHVITVNEYLAKRDYEQIGKIHKFLGLTVGLNVPMLNPVEKKQAYQADITYGIGTEFGFDYLRDNMAYQIPAKVQRPYHYAIIDEVDSVLIDEAKTPLIIAGKMGVSAHLHQICARLAKRFKQDEDYLFDNETKATSLTDKGIDQVEKAFGVDNLYELEHQTLYHYMIQALRAHVMFNRDVDYIVHDGKIKLVDMFTGRIMEGRSLSDGLHQALEAKEGLEITEENKAQASITIQNYFRMYPHLSGMTGTAKTEEGEFRHVYSLEVVQIPTNKPIIRVDMPDQIYKTAHDKYKAVAKEVKERHQTGQPVLVGTTSILQSEKIAEYLTEEDLSFELLNAKSVEQEVRLISLAGQKGHITIATNMAGRGTDIELGEGVAEIGGLHVIGTERHESRRIDNQLKGRSGRQGDPGSTQFLISLEDEMLTRFAKEELENKILKKIEVDENGLVLSKIAHEFVNRTQRICEGSNFAIREYNLKLDDVINHQRNVTYSIRNNTLAAENLLTLIKPRIKSHVEYLIESMCPEEMLAEEWDTDALQQQLENIIIAEQEISLHRLETIEELKAGMEPYLQTYFEQLDELGKDVKFQEALRRLYLTVVDQNWIKHLEAMQRMKEGIGMRHYQQEDPMRLYQKEGLEIFEKTYALIEKEISTHVANMVRPVLNKTEKES